MLTPNQREPTYLPIDRRDNVAVPVGPENVLPVYTEPGIELSDLVIAERGPDLSTEVTSMPVGEPGYLGITQAGRDYMARQQQTFVSADEGDGDGMSFWDDLGDVAIGYITSELATGTSGPTTIVSGTEVVEQTQGEFIGRTGPPVNPSTGQPYKNMLWNPRLGKWVRCRRRRRKLLTDSDFNSLLKLQTLKVNQNMTIAIAKTLGR